MIPSAVVADCSPNTRRSLAATTAAPFGGHAPKNHRELLATEAADEVARAHVRAEHAGYVAQYLVAHQLTEALVYLVEAVQVEDQQGQRAAVALAVVDRVPELGQQRDLVQQAGQRVADQQLAKAAPPLGPHDHRLEQELRVDRRREKSSAPA